jgi:TadE-like protein
MKEKNNPALLPRQRGQAVVEYVYVLPILLILLLGTLQFVFIYEAKLTLNQAVFVGTRQGALNSGSMSAIQDGLEAGLAPLYVHDTTLWALKAGRQIAHEQLSTSGLALTTIVNPTSSALSGFQQTQADGNMGIPNDNLMYRDPGDLQDGMNVQDANLLKVRVTVCFEMIVPIVNRMIYTFLSGTSSPAVADSYSGGSIAAPELLHAGTPNIQGGVCNGDPESTYAASYLNWPGIAAGSQAISQNPAKKYGYRIPITSEAVVRMQSPFEDPNGWTFP